LARVRKQLLQGEMVSLSCCLFLSSISMSWKMDYYAKMKREKKLCWWWRGWR
jgi:hypothetical protein